MDQLTIPGCGVSLEEYEAAAIAALRHYESAALRLNPDGYYLADSFGKDSCVILDLAKRAGVRFVAHHNLTTLDPPELIHFGREYHPETVIHRPAKPMLRRMVDKGIVPTRKMRWCCEEYKEAGGNHAFAIYGVRAAESPRRAKQWRILQKNWRLDGNGMILAPIVDWPDHIVWEYLRSHETPYCSLYDEGWSRLGCIGCPMSGRARQRDFDRWPKIEARWRRAFDKLWNQWKDKPTRAGKVRFVGTFPSSEAFWKWWRDDKPSLGEDEGCQRGLF